ncbi:LysR family transcriptional regulator [Microbacterium sp. NPDC058062]|uniref:LysR family transcriptional regulator n=1 Tax=Microbacterium sp. NPDC058062 TaxID=3346320 RepID=UPI0036DCCDAE
MELRQLRYFSAVVEEGSLTAAAAALHLSQPALSVAVGKLESEVGVSLLTRSPRGVEATSAGRYLLEVASRVLAETDEATRVLRRFGDGFAGTLTMAVVPALTWNRLPVLLRAHSAESPDVDIRLISPPPWTAIDMLQQRTADLAAILVADAPRFAERHSASLRIVDWGDIPLVAALPPDRAPAGDTLPLSALDGSVLVLPQSAAALPSLPEIVLEGIRRHGVSPGSVRRVDTIQTCIPLVEAGLAWSILPDADRASLRGFDIAVRRLEPSLPSLRALVLARADRSPNMTLENLLRRISETRSASS